MPASAYLHRLVVGAEDIDEQGHANNAAYVRWMDRAAVAHSAALGWDWAAYRRIGAAFVVRRHEIEYLSPAFEGEAVVAATWPAEMGRASAVRMHRVLRVADGRVLLRARTDWAFIDLSTGRPRRVPEDLRTAFDSLF